MYIRNVYIDYIVYSFTLYSWYFLKKSRSLVPNFTQYQFFVTMAMSAISQPERIAKSLLENVDKASQVKSYASAIEKCFDFEQLWHNKHTKLLKSKSYWSFKSSSNHTSSSSTSSIAAAKSKENLLKLRNDAAKPKLYAEQAGEQPKSKSCLIREKQESVEAETLSILVEDKEQLKEAQMHNNADHISNDSAKLKPFAHVNHPRNNLNPSSLKFNVLSDPHLIH